MNKYKAESCRAQKMRKLSKMCLSKRRYATKEEAFQKGNDCYPCGFCGGWHRTGSLATPVVKARGRK